MSEPRILTGDSLELMRDLDEASVSAIVTDPPYGLEFMGREWDKFRVDDPGTARHRGERAGEHGERGGDGSHPARRERAAVAYGGGKRPGTFRCTGCGKRDQFRNEHDCADGARWARELIDPHSAPPTMLAFQEWCRQWALEAYRVLKPGGHLLAFGGTRTYHRLAAGLEDAGFEIRDSVMWLYGSGFPKSLDVSKAIDKAAGAEREVTGPGRYAGRESEADLGVMNDDAWEGGAPRVDTVPATSEAQQWEGWGTALKPAHEPIVVARKPASQSIAANMLEHGTGALNIDAGRVELPEGDQIAAGLSDPANRAGVVGSKLLSPKPAEGETEDERRERFQAAQLDSVERSNRLGRWPANIVLQHLPECEPRGVKRVRSESPSVPQPEFDSPTGAVYEMRAGEGRNGAYSDGYSEDGTEVIEDWDCAPGCPVAELDAQSGERPGGAFPARRSSAKFSERVYRGWEAGTTGERQMLDSGGASRFFYCAKASRQERNAGLEAREPTRHANYSGGRSRQCRQCGSRSKRPRDTEAWPACGHDDWEWVEQGDDAHKGVLLNDHPTVKPIDLMRWLVRLVAPPGGVILDPFLGSGTTGCAAALEGVDFIGIEKTPEHAELARERIAFWARYPEDTETAAVLVSAARERETVAAGQLGLLGGDEDGDSE